MRLAFALTTSLLGAASAATQAPAGIQNARLETRAAAAGLEKEVRALLSSRAEPFWLGYSVPSGRRRGACCWSSTDDVDRCGGGCRLESRKEAFQSEAQAPVALEGAGRIRVLARAEGGRLVRLRAFTEDCALDAGGLPFVWLEGVRPAESVAWLSALLERAGDSPADEDEHDGDKLGHQALMAVAFHADTSADAALERWVAPGQPRQRRKQAAFWMGVERGARGRDTLIRLVRQDPDPKLREHVVFALTQSRQPGAIEAVIEVAKKDADPHVRGQALFWLAQSAAKQARAAVRAAVDDDPEVEVKKKAVFALSQLPQDEGVPLLIELARNHNSAAVRKQAMFWLGQSQDARALAFFEEVLTR